MNDFSELQEFFNGLKEIQEIGYQYQIAYPKKGRPERRTIKPDSDEWLNMLDFIGWVNSFDNITGIAIDNRMIKGGRVENGYFSCQYVTETTSSQTSELLNAMIESQKNHNTLVSAIINPASAIIQHASDTLKKTSEILEKFGSTVAQQLQEERTDRKTAERELNRVREEAHGAELAQVIEISAITSENQQPPEKDPIEHVLDMANKAVPVVKAVKGLLSE